MFAWLGLLPRAKRLASLKKISYFLAKRAAATVAAVFVAVAAAVKERGDVGRRREDEDEAEDPPRRGFHNVPVLRRKVCKLPRVLLTTRSENQPLMSLRPEKREGERCRPVASAKRRFAEEDRENHVFLRLLEHVECD